MIVYYYYYYYCSSRLNFSSFFSLALNITYTFIRTPENEKNKRIYTTRGALLAARVHTVLCTDQQQLVSARV